MRINPAPLITYRSDLVRLVAVLSVGGLLFGAICGGLGYRAGQLQAEQAAQLQVLQIRIDLERERTDALQRLAARRAHDVDVADRLAGRVYDQLIALHLAKLREQRLRRSLSSCRAARHFAPSNTTHRRQP